MVKPKKYEVGLDRNEANYVSLSPLSFARRTAEVFPDRVAVIHGDTRFTWSETYARCRRLSSALVARGIGKGDTVAVMAPNVPALLEAHFGVPMCGAVLNALNVRLDAKTIAFILDHGEAKVLITDRQFSPVISAALEILESKPLVVDIDDPLATSGELLGELNYEQLLDEGDPEHRWSLPQDEWDAISLNYTSGTTGNPKGVVYHHRGAYMNAIGNILAWGMSHRPIYLWTLPMFHCNGWCFPWSITAMGGTHVCLRGVEPKAVFDSIRAHDVTHLCGAPIVMNLLLNSPEAESFDLSRRIQIMTAGAAPPAAVLERMDTLGFDVTHTYGLTEVYGPITVCDWHPEWNARTVAEQATLKARQGVKYQVQEDFFVADPETLAPTPSDGETMGELMFRGNVVMKGYLKNPDATRDAFSGGLFHTGDLGVTHPDGYIEIRDRSKDVIISGGENISSIEVEGVLYRHPAVMEAAVVARPDDKWGETPCAFVTLKSGESATQADLIEFCRDNMAHFKCPKTIVFTDLPKTSTGKIQKYVLREQAKAMLNELK
ncbi:MAG: acyl-CoA synthetase [Gammaproteobacteria bacterium]|nr:acyl-CoA synthetase [Gammaproteobacteria bacterium]